MSEIDKEVEQKKAIEVKCKTSSGKLSVVRIDDEESSSSSSMSLYNIELDEKHSEVSSRRTPTIIENQVPEQICEFHSSPTDSGQELVRKALSNPTNRRGSVELQH